MSDGTVKVFVSTGANRGYYADIPVRVASDGLGTPQANALRDYLADGVLQKGTLAISATTHEYKTTTTMYWRRLGIQFTKAATDNLAFASAYTINTAAGAGKLHGAFLVETTDTGTITAKASAANQVYTTKAAALAALPAVTAGSTVIGAIAVQAKEATAWIANTDDMTAASDCESREFIDATELTLPAAY
jgi:hypothetical protein